MAEKEGFEPSKPFWGLHDFQSCALDQARRLLHNLIGGLKAIWLKRLIIVLALFFFVNCYGLCAIIKPECEVFYMKIRKLLAVIAAIMTLVIGFSSCALIGESAATEAYVPEYGEVTELIKVYEDSYRSYVQNGEGGVTAVSCSSYTPLGAPCNATYTLTEGNEFESCSLAVQREFEQHDEYFNVCPEFMMFVRSYIDPAGTIVINKYISTSSGVYYVNEETSTLDLIEDVEALDCFVTFDQVRRAYGTEQDASETQTGA